VSLEFIVTVVFSNLDAATVLYRLSANGAQQLVRFGSSQVAAWDLGGECKAAGDQNDRTDYRDHAPIEYAFSQPPALVAGASCGRSSSPIRAFFSSDGERIMERFTGLWVRVRTSEDSVQGTIRSVRRQFRLRLGATGTATGAQGIHEASSLGADIACLKV